MIKNAKIVKVNCPQDEYVKQDAKRGDKSFVMSRSELVEFALNPRRWLDGFGLPDEDEEEETTPSLDWGSLIDALVSGVDVFESRFAVCPATYTNKKGEESKWSAKSKDCADWEAERRAAGLVVIRAPIMAKAEKAVAAIKADTELSELLKASQKQVYVTGIWKNKDSGLEIPIKALLDIVPPKDMPVYGKCLFDFKTARNGDPAKWPRVIDDESYDVQGALHFDLYVAATKEDRTDFGHIVQENVKPYHIVKPFPSLTTEFMAWGRMKYQNALLMYALCLQTGEWPSYAPAGLCYGGLQLLDPKDLWNYRKMAGQGSLQAVAPMLNVPPPDDPRGDLAP